MAACAASLYKCHHGRAPHAKVARNSSLPELSSEQRLQPWAASGCPCDQLRITHAVPDAVRCGWNTNERGQLGTLAVNKVPALFTDGTQTCGTADRCGVLSRFSVRPMRSPSNEINPHARNLHSHHGLKGPVHHLEQATCSRTANTARGGAESGLNRRKIKQHGHVIRLETSVLLQLNNRAIR